MSSDYDRASVSPRLRETVSTRKPPSPRGAGDQLTRASATASAYPVPAPESVAVIVISITIFLLYTSIN